MKRCALYTRVSTGEQSVGAQVNDLEQTARQRDYQIVARYTDQVSGAKARRPGLDQLLHDARRGQFDIVLVAAFDRIARSTRHLLEVLDELNSVGVAYISLRESIDSSGPLGRAIVTIVGAVAELERHLVIERVRAGMRRAKLEGRRIGRPALNVDRAGVVRDRQHGQSLGEIAKAYKISRASVARIVAVSEGVLEQEPQITDNRSPKMAA